MKDNTKEKREVYDASSEPHIHRMFEIIAGTSTGSIIACAISRLHMNPEEVINEAKKIAEQIFPKPGAWDILGKIKNFVFTGLAYLSNTCAIYDHRVIEDYLRRRLENCEWGRKQEYGVYVEPILGILSTRSDNSQIHIFDSRIYEHSNRVHIYDAVRASTAAPTYFLPKEISDDMILKKELEIEDKLSKLLQF